MEFLSTLQLTTEQTTEISTEQTSPNSGPTATATEIPVHHAGFPSFLYSTTTELGRLSTFSVLSNYQDHTNHNFSLFPSALLPLITILPVPLPRTRSEPATQSQSSQFEGQLNSTCLACTCKSVLDKRTDGDGNGIRQDICS